MSNKRSLRPIRILALGAINGLLVGLALEKARTTLLNYQASQAAQEHGAIGWTFDYIQALWGPWMPLVYIPVFAIVAYFVNQYFKSRPTLLLSLWFGLGAVAIGAGYFMSTSNPDVFSFLWLLSLVAVSYLVHRLWKSRPDSIFLFWLVNGISAVVVIAFAVQLLGLFVYFVYWRELRSLSLWSIFLLGIVAINAVYGAVVHLISDRFSRRKHARANS